MERDATIKDINNNAIWLTELDKDGADYKITMNEYKACLENKKLHKNLTGMDSTGSWEEFKKKFIYMQAHLGFHWIRAQGGGGVIKLVEIDLPESVGAELAKICLKDGIENGVYHDVISKYIPQLSAYLNRNFELVKIEDSKEAFRSTAVNGVGYKFRKGRGSKNFYKATDEYTYQGSEQEFGELILAELKEALKLTDLQHAQTSRSMGKYKNVDFVGHFVDRKLMGDELLIYNFELKPSNKITYVSEAISQAVNYKPLGQYTYIIIPMFSQDNYFDEDRYSDFLSICEKSEIGVISVQMDLGAYDRENGRDKVKEIQEVLPAKRLEIDDSVIRDFIREKYEICPLCKRYINIEAESESECGWPYSNEQGSVCMRRAFEQSIGIAALNRNKEAGNE